MGRPFNSVLNFFLNFFTDLNVWQIKDNKLINKGTGLEYSYDTSKQGYDLDGMIIKEIYIKDYLKTAQHKWRLHQEDDETFKIQCKTNGSFLRAKSINDAEVINSGILSFLTVS